MDIQVKDPSTGALLMLDARPEQHRGEHGFRIRHPNGSGFLIVNRSGTWRVADDHHIDAGFLINIGLALEGHSVREQTGTNAKESSQAGDDLPYTDNQPNINSGFGDEGMINPNES
ncbi:hypothetical protein [Mucilaginibacter sp.]|uniref:hypothetical protein n=1 Tax=Mucilaginibacter sp. TaxID=1882438 RepID=UPI0026073689|nr:hypothetical protein [Mucilaginibacter sp.]MDB4924441.1 hypothetical protein [Mucilaginibacter sp.]